MINICAVKQKQMDLNPKCMNGTGNERKIYMEYISMQENARKNNNFKAILFSEKSFISLNKQTKNLFFF